MKIEFRNVMGHIEVFRDGEFWFSADNMSEAIKEMYSDDKCQRKGFD